MKVKTSVTISADLLEQIDDFAKNFRNRSELFEEALREYLTKLMRERRDARDAEIINQNAEAINKEAMDVLDYQFNW
jgi:metal-responsive CopG/Arc/MetJ family transcriptional regulator